MSRSVYLLAAELVDGALVIGSVPARRDGRTLLAVDPETLDALRAELRGRVAAFDARAEERMREVNAAYVGSMS